jgi:hypothetical protein
LVPLAHAQNGREGAWAILREGWESPVVILNPFYALANKNLYCRDAGVGSFMSRVILEQIRQRKTDGTPRED